MVDAPEKAIIMPCDACFIVDLSLAFTDTTDFTQTQEFQDQPQNLSTLASSL
jgi:hypothetical protein